MDIEDIEKPYCKKWNSVSMRVNTIRKMDISNGEGIGVALFTQGCPFRCYNCFNSETWEYDSGEIFCQKHEDTILGLLNSPHIKRFSILGGEPLIARNHDTLLDLVLKVKSAYPDKKIWLYSGRTFENVKEKFMDIIKNVDILIDGRFIDALKDPKLKWRGSSNQRVIDVQKTLNGKNIVLYESA